MSKPEILEIQSMNSRQKNMKKTTQKHNFHLLKTSDRGHLMKTKGTKKHIKYRGAKKSDSRFYFCSRNNVNQNKVKQNLIITEK